MRMKLVIFSDAHGNKAVVDRILEWNQDSDYFLSLGDIELPQDYLMHKDIVMIKGNSRVDPGFVFERELEVESIKVFMTHGHKYHVHKSLHPLAKLAIRNHYDIVLFGHTHIVEVTKIGQVQFLNPGSCARPRNTLPPTYAILNVTDKEYTIEVKDAINNRTIEV